MRVPVITGRGWRRRPPDMETAANISNKQSRTADKGRPSSLEVGRKGNNPHLQKKKKGMLRNVTLGLGLRRILWNDLDNEKWTRDLDIREIGLKVLNWIHLAQKRKKSWALVSTVVKLRVSYKAGNFLIVLLSASLGVCSISFSYEHRYHITIFLFVWYQYYYRGYGGTIKTEL
jgi:hypothetical protein